MSRRWSNSNANIVAWSAAAAAATAGVCHPHLVTCAVHCAILLATWWLLLPRSCSACLACFWRCFALSSLSAFHVSKWVRKKIDTKVQQKVKDLRTPFKPSDFGSVVIFTLCIVTLSKMSAEWREGAEGAIIPVDVGLFQNFDHRNNGTHFYILYSMTTSAVTADIWNWHFRTLFAGK